MLSDLRWRSASLLPCCNGWCKLETINLQVKTLMAMTSRWKNDYWWSCQRQSRIGKSNPFRLQASEWFAALLLLPSAQNYRYEISFPPQLRYESAAATSMALEHNGWVCSGGRLGRKYRVNRKDGVFLVSINFYFNLLLCRSIQPRPWRCLVSFSVLDGFLIS